MAISFLDPSQRDEARQKRSSPSSHAQLHDLKGSRRLVLMKQGAVCCSITVLSKTRPSKCSEEHRSSRPTFHGCSRSARRQRSHKQEAGSSGLSLHTARSGLSASFTSRCRPWKPVRPSHISMAAGSAQKRPSPRYNTEAQHNFQARLAHGCTICNTLAMAKTLALRGGNKEEKEEQGKGIAAAQHVYQH